MKKTYLKVVYPKVKSRGMLEDSFKERLSEVPRGDYPTKNAIREYEEI